MSFFCFFGFFFHFVFSNNSQTLWCFQSLFAGPVAVHAGYLLQQRKLKSVKKQKSYKQKNKKQYVFFFFFCFFHFVFWSNFRTLRSFRSRLAACGCCHHSASFETKNNKIGRETKKLRQKNKILRTWKIFTSPDVATENNQLLKKKEVRRNFVFWPNFFVLPGIRTQFAGKLAGIEAQFLKKKKQKKVEKQKSYSKKTKKKQKFSDFFFFLFFWFCFP